jgi:hypothetical protein
MTLRVETPPSFRPEREWVFRVVGERLGISFRHAIAERSDVRITDGERELLLPDGLFGHAETDWLTKRSMPSRPLANTDSGLPVLYGSTAAPDLLGGIFFLLTRYEEAVSTERDEHDRFPVRASLAAEEGFVERPLADEYVDALWARLKAVWPRLERRSSQFRVIPTHDVDSPRSEGRGLARELVSVAADLVRRRDPALAVRRLRFVGGSGPDPLDTFDQLMEASESRGLRAAFYFMSGPDAEYSLDDPAIVALLRRVNERGHEIGFHAGYKSFRDPSVFRAEVEELRRVCREAGIEQEIRGGRQHFLRWENPTTWRIWDEAGLEYESTLGFADAPGFRCGTCHEFPVFDLGARRALRLRERPLIAMEVSALGYLGLRPTAALARFAALKDRCREAGGDFVALWHNTMVADRTGLRLYEAVLDA